MCQLRLRGSVKWQKIDSIRNKADWNRNTTDCFGWIGVMLQKSP